MMDKMENMMENDGEHADETSKSSNESNAKKVFKVISQSLTNLRILNLIYAGQLLGLWKLWI